MQFKIRHILLTVIVISSVLAIGRLFPVWTPIGIVFLMAGGLAGFCKTPLSWRRMVSRVAFGLKSTVVIGLALAYLFFVLTDLQTGDLIIWMILFCGVIGTWFGGFIVGASTRLRIHSHQQFQKSGNTKKLNSV